MLHSELADYVEGLIVPQGRLAGEHFELFPWQRRFLRGAFAPNVATAALSVARGAGKSTFIGAIGAASIDGPLVQPAAENVIVASSFQQGEIIFRHVMAFLRPAFQSQPSRFGILDNANRKQITDRETGAILKVLGSDPRRMHGLAFALALLDELAQWPTNAIDRSLAALVTAHGKIPDSRMLTIGTRPASSDHPFEIMLDHTADYSQTHAARESDPVFQRRTWARANPSLSRMPDLERAIRRESKIAKRDPQALATFRALRLNQGVPDTVESVILEPKTWEDAEGDAEQTGGFALGLDIGTSSAMSAAAAYYPASGRLDGFAVFPELPSLAERGLRDGVGARYERMAERGELIQSGLRVSDIGGLLDEVLNRWGEPSVITCDAWRFEELREQLESSGFPYVEVETRRNGPRDGSEDLRRFRRAFLEGRVTPVESLLMRSALSEARATSDASGNVRLAKKSEAGRRQRAKDDVMAASILAVAVGDRAYQGPRTVHSEPQETVSAVS